LPKYDKILLEKVFKLYQNAVMNFTVIKTKNLQNLSLTNKKQPISVAVAQLLFFEKSFQKNKILTSFIR
jgi:hypothetical protein